MIKIVKHPNLRNARLKDNRTTKNSKRTDLRQSDSILTFKKKISTKQNFVNNFSLKENVDIKQDANSLMESKSSEKNLNKNATVGKK
jgi:hypothetical protein